MPTYFVDVDFSELKEKHIIKLGGIFINSIYIGILCSDSTKYRIYNSNKGHEVVYISKVTGDISKLLNSKIIDCYLKNNCIHIISDESICLEYCKSFECKEILTIQKLIEE